MVHNSTETRTHIQADPPIHLKNELVCSTLVYINYRLRHFEKRHSSI